MRRLLQASFGAWLLTATVALAATPVDVKIDSGVLSGATGASPEVLVRV